MIENVDLDGVVVPGLRGSFHRRRGEAASDDAVASRISTVGVYRFAGVDLLMAWGYVGEPHCRFTSVRRPDGTWEPPRPGCPPVTRVHDGGLVTALTLGGHVLPAEPVTSPPPGGARATAPDSVLAAVGGPGVRT
ncbi:hypothetical protein [Phytohabitans rumicis]|uniref:hypothetical protein n=1 Tax=Phytohabitans rumicis TaxID=1076125 RepID=UPI001562F596|nr:hypothetical protein [Phytohabitans rumicis]